MLDSTTQTRYGGSVPCDYLAETPANVVLFAGYSFAKEYRQARGHLHAIEDVTQPVEYPDISSKEKAQALIQQFIDGPFPKMIAQGE